MTKFNTRTCFWLLLMVACITIIPALGLTDFHTKGEPREAVVAYTMLENGNWVLPRNNGGEIPYKPPFFHWTIAGVSLLNGGVVNEFTSRFPSAMALIAMTMVVFIFYSRRKGSNIALLTAFVSLTAFELHRAGANCRVDMMLTALSVVSLCLFYRYWERGLKGVPWLPILLMSCATLTKGPVGTLIPCLAFGVFLLLRGVNFFKAFGLLSAWGLASLVLPFCWYWAAYLQGGQEFLDLALEENFGRMTSTMSYESCVNPWPYNFVTLAGGYIPWILLVGLSLFTLHFKFAKHLKTSGSIKSLSTRILHCDPVNMFSAVCIVVIFLFYCFPQSKRSVYLMPIYPFIAYFLACYMIYLVKAKSASIRIYGNIMAFVGIVLTGIFIAIKCGLVTSEIFSGSHAVENAAMLHELEGISWWRWLPAVVPTALSIGWWYWTSRQKTLSIGYLYAICAMTFGLYFALDTVYQPHILHAKSQRIVAEQIDDLAPASAGTIYEFIEEGETALGDPIHFFEINFYLGDRIENFRRNMPSDGFLLINAGEDDKFFPLFEEEGYRFEEVYNSPVSFRPVRLYKFNRQNEAFNL